MSAKSQHQNILLAVMGFSIAVLIVAIIGFFTLGKTDEVIQGEVEVGEYRVSCKLPARVVEIRVKEGDFVHKGDTLAILEIPEMNAQEKVAQSTEAATQALSNLTEEGAPRSHTERAATRGSGQGRNRRGQEDLRPHAEPFQRRRDESAETR